MKKRKFTNTRLFKLLRALIIIIIIVIIIRVIINIVSNRNNDIKLVIGDEVIDLEYELLIDDENNIYISKNDLASIYDENIYYNSSEKILITTFNKHVAKLEMGKDIMEVNSEAVVLNGTLKMEDDMLYIPLLDMGVVYDFEYEFNEDENVLILDSISLSKSQAVVIKNVKVKEEPKGSSKTLERLKRSDAMYVTVFDSDDSYVKVRTNLGNVGYIKTSAISDIETLRDDMEDESLNDVVILENYASIQSYEVLEKSEDFNIVIPNIFNINEDLDIENEIDLESSAFTEYKEWAEESNVNIAANITLTGSMNEICSSYTTRTILINNICNTLTSNEIRMVCIDFEGIDDLEGFYRFIIELTPRLKDNGYKILVKSDDTLDLDRLNSIVDYVVNK